MENSNENIINDFLFQLKEVNKMIALHDEDGFMQCQYKALREQFINNLLLKLNNSDMSHPKKYQDITHLLQEIEKLNQMIQRFENNSFLAKQYKALKKRYMQQLEEKLLTFELKVSVEDLAA